MGVTAIGILQLQPSINPTEFLPRKSKVLSDLHRIENDVTNIDSIEAVVDLGGEKMAFVDQLSRVRGIEAKIAAHPGVRHTLSLASFFPEEMPENAMAAARILGHAKSYSGEDGFVAGVEDTGEEGLGERAGEAGEGALRLEGRFRGERVLEGEVTPDF